ncbi:MAG: hypothetical protein NVS2B15_11900 [Pseudarthrobacter sp.]
MHEVLIGLVFGGRGHQDRGVRKGFQPRWLFSGRFPGQRTDHPDTIRPVGMRIFKRLCCCDEQKGRGAEEFVGASDQGQLAAGNFRSQFVHCGQHQFLNGADH